MSQTIDPIKLKTAAEYLEWVLRQYPDSLEVQSLRQALLPLIEAAKAQAIVEPIERDKIPGAFNFTDGLYVPFNDPNVGNAYTTFRIEIRGGLSEKEKRNIAQLEQMRAGVDHG